MWQENQPEAPMSPFHPEELPVGLRSPFPGFSIDSKIFNCSQYYVTRFYFWGDSIYEKVIRPYLRNNYVARQYNANNDADRNVLFRHEVEKLKYRPEMHHTQKSTPGRATHQEKKIVSTNSVKLRNGQVPQTPRIGDLPLSDPRKPILYSDFVFHIWSILA